ncbi:ATP-binding protein [Catenovulum agarivorans]|uniref:ATP-binding protein n=1 Tax=Catenovulum agarivorans TaxID=1172192 RepID=UPI0002EBE076|nr:ATP-binding protein [Catenovulum agarivorans]
MLNKIKVPIWIIITLLIVSVALSSVVAQQAIKHYSFAAWLHGDVSPASKSFTQISNRQLTTQYELLQQFTALVTMSSQISADEYNQWVKYQIANNAELLAASLALYSTKNARLQHIYSVGTASKYQQDSYQSELLAAIRKSQNTTGIISKRLSSDTLLLAKSVKLANEQWFLLSEVDLSLIKLALIQAHPQTKLNFSLQLTDKQQTPIVNWEFGKLHTQKNQISQRVENEFFILDIIAEPRATFAPKWHAPEISKFIASVIVGTLLVCLLLVLLWYQQRKSLQLAQTLEQQNALLGNQLSAAKESIKRNSRFAIINDMAPIAAAEITPAVSQAIKAVSSLEERTINLKNKLTDGKVTKSLVGSYLDNATQLTRASSSQLLIAAEATYTLEQFASDLKQDTLRDINLQLHTAAISGIYKKSNQHKKVKFIESIPGDLDLTAYSGSLTHVICIVLNNSIEHGFAGRPDGIVMIEAFKNKDKQSIQMRIEDNGAGMDEAMLANVFATESIDTHSGLHLAKQLVDDKLLGKMEVNSKLGRFTRVNLTLPIDVNKGLPKEQTKR